MYYLSKKCILFSKVSVGTWTLIFVFSYAVINYYNNEYTYEVKYNNSTDSLRKSYKSLLHVLCKKDNSALILHDELLTNCRQLTDNLHIK